MTFPQFCVTLGILPPEDIIPGKTIRAPTESHPRKRNALIRLDADGKAGIAINYELGEDPQQWRLNGDKPEPIDNAALTARIEKRRQQERRGTERARAAYEAAEPIVSAAHQYLERKRIEEGFRGLRVDESGNLLIPMFDRYGRMISVQRINEAGEKKFAFGAPSKGAHFWIDRPRSCVTVLCEGFCTGATIFSALQTARICVCFSAANLVTVAERGEWSGMVAVAADDDKDTQENIGQNPGIEYATKAAAIIGCGVAFPQCEGTDMNDWFVERLEKLEAAPSKFRNNYRLRAEALAPIAAEIMRAAKKVSISTPGNKLKK